MGKRDVTAHGLTGAGGDFNVVVLGGTLDGRENRPCAAVFGRPKDGCLVRIHSRCVYGEIFGSVDCDCREQLRRSIAKMRKAGSGVLIYLDQEGRGAGLHAKARGYQLSQRTGMDTFSSYQHLKLPEDSRSYEDAAKLLRKLRLRRVTLLTNNPAKVQALQVAGITVTLRPLVVPDLGKHAREYLAAKARRGHMISGWNDLIAGSAVEPFAERGGGRRVVSRRARTLPLRVLTGLRAALRWLGAGRAGSWRDPSRVRRSVPG